MDTCVWTHVRTNEIRGCLKLFVHRHTHTPDSPLSASPQVFSPTTAPTSAPVVPPAITVRSFKSHGWAALNDTMATKKVITTVLLFHAI